MNLLLIIQLLNIVILYFGFTMINHKSRVENGQVVERKGLTVVHSIVTFILFTLPAIWIVILLPSVIILAQGGLH